MVHFSLSFPFSKSCYQTNPRSKILSARNELRLAEFLAKGFLEKRKHPSLVRVQTCTDTMQIIVEDPQTVRCRSTKKCSFPVLGHIPKGLYYTDTYSSIFIAVLLIMARNLKQASCPSTDEWIMKMWCIYTMEYYLAVKRMKLLNSQVSGWM